MTAAQHDPPTPQDMALKPGSSAPATRPLYLLGALFAVCTGPAFLLDHQLASWTTGWDKDSTLMKISEVFGIPGSFSGLLVLGAVILILDRSARRRMLRLAAALLTAGVITGLLKALFSRQRPLHFDLNQDIWSSFSGFFASLLQDGEWIIPQHWTMVSFPSGHLTSVAAAAVGLSWLYPRGRWLLAGMAVLVAAERFAFQLHFLSDLCAGAAIGTLVTACFLDTRLLGRHFDKFEEAV
jgi:membrane-associated phospholipid phosphatase